MYSKNNNGPRTLPCGTPDTTSILELNTTLWVRLDKKFWKTFKIKPPTPASRNLNTRPPWLTLSKAALKSIWTGARSPPLSNSNWPAQTMSRRASQVPNLFLYEYWWEDRTPDLSKKRPKHKAINLSKTFDRTGVIEIGRWLQTSAYKEPLGFGVTSAIRHSSGNSPPRNNPRKRQLSFGARTEAVFRKNMGKQPDGSTPPFWSRSNRCCSTSRALKVMPQNGNEVSNEDHKN